jgi:hypothetical protein
MRRMGLLTAGIASATSGLVMIAACEDSGTSGAEGVDSSSPRFDSSVVPTDSSVPPKDSSLPLVDSAIPTCNLLDAGLDASSFDAAALVCPAGQWRDFAASTCKSCPSTQVTCSALVRDAVDGGAQASPRWNHDFGMGKQTITTILAGGTAQIVYATATAVVGTCFTANSNGANTIDIPVTIDGNALISTFPSAPVDGGAGTQTPCGTLTYTLVDSCCNSRVVNVRLVTNQESQSEVLDRSCPDGG